MAGWCFAGIAKAGEPEAPNPAAEPTNSVIDEASRWLGSRNMTGHRGPWCAAFANFILEKTGHAPMNGNDVTAALHYGHHLAKPEVGAMAVVSTSYGREGHVGFVEGVNADGSIRLISGNWSHKVGEAVFSRRQVMAFVEVP